MCAGAGNLLTLQHGTATPVVVGTRFTAPALQATPQVALACNTTPLTCGICCAFISIASINTGVNIGG